MDILVLDSSIPGKKIGFHPSLSGDHILVTHIRIGKGFRVQQIDRAQADRLHEWLTQFLQRHTDQGG